MGKMMTNLERLMAFFEAENKRDWQSYQAFLADHVQWELHSSSPLVIKGKENYLKKIQAAYQGSAVQFTCQYFYASSDQNRIVTILRNNAGELSCDIFEFQDNLIIKETEYILKKVD